MLLFPAANAARLRGEERETMDMLEIPFEPRSLEHDEFRVSWFFTDAAEGTMAAILDEMWQTSEVRLGNIGALPPLD